jgi:hypothetical protein
VKINSIIKILFLIALLTFFGVGLTYSKQERIDPKKIEAIKKQSEYDYFKSYSSKKEKPKDLKKESNSENWSFLKRVGDNIHILFIIVFVLIAGFLIYSLVTEGGFSKRIFRLKKRDSIVVLETIDEEKIEENDFDILIRTAYGNFDYRLVLRLMFLKNLQLLNNRNHIIYKKNKTNYEYSLEIKNQYLKQDFLQVSDVFSWVWYGLETVDETIFVKYEPMFKDLENKIV